jgi:hypothetical protein
MKTQEEIEQLAIEHAHLKPNFDRVEEEYYNIGAINAYESFIDGYTQCQEDMGKELEALRAAIRKNTWYDIDGNAQVGLYGIDNNLLNKQY